MALAPLPSGESLLINDWNASPNTVSAMTTDGATTTKIFEAYRVWSMGATATGDTIAFACGDPNQKQHYGIDVGDAIQHTWLYDDASMTAKVLAWGNLNDECHTFGALKKNLYICRRYDFQPDGSSKGYRLARLDLATGAPEWLSPDDPNLFGLDPQPFADEKSMLFRAIKIMGAMQSPAIDREALPPGASMLVRDKAGAPVLSPDQTRYAYADYTDKGAIYASDLDGKNVVKIATEHGDHVSFSPDGTRVAFLVFDNNAGCSHVDVAKVDGSQADAPVRLRDCTKTMDFVTELAWIKR